LKLSRAEGAGAAPPLEGLDVGAEAATAAGAAFLTAGAALAAGFLP